MPHSCYGVRRLLAKLDSLTDGRVSQDDSVAQDEPQQYTTANLLLPATAAVAYERCPVIPPPPPPPNPFELKVLLRMSCANCMLIYPSSASQSFARCTNVR